VRLVAAVRIPGESIAWRDDETPETESKDWEVMSLEQTLFGGMKLSSWSFRLTGTLLVLMLPIFFVGRVLQLSQQAANTALGIGAAVAVIVGTIAVIWKK
jgi:hypothetical protein